MPGQTGVIVDRPEELPAAISAARRLDPGICRKHVEANFTTDLMAAGYEAAYLQTLAEIAGPRVLLAERAGTGPGSSAEDAPTVQDLIALSDDPRPVGR